MYDLDLKYYTSIGYHDLQRGLLIGAAVLGLLLPPTGVFDTGFNAEKPGKPRKASVAKSISFGGEYPSLEVRQLSNWIVRASNSSGMSFIVIDKQNAKLYAFSGDGAFYGATPVLIGSAIGDDTVEGIGERPISQVLPEERTTPAGRFRSEPGKNSLGEDVVWVDYENGVSMHRVRANNPHEQRLRRLETPTASDNRISYGCINIPVEFYDKIIRPAFGHEHGVVYVLPDVKAPRTVFPEAYGL